MLLYNAETVQCAAASDPSTIFLNLLHQMLAGAGSSYSIKPGRASCVQLSENGVGLEQESQASSQG
jgi:hypothetical protein